jgi:hypothetical protein
LDGSLFCASYSSALIFRPSLRALIFRSSKSHGLREIIHNILEFCEESIIACCRMQAARVPSALRWVRVVPGFHDWWPQLARMQDEHIGSNIVQDRLRSEGKKNVGNGGGTFPDAIVPTRSNPRDSPTSSTFSLRGLLQLAPPCVSSDYYTAAHTRHLILHSFHTSTSQACNKGKDPDAPTNTAGSTDPTVTPSALGGWEPDRVITLANGISMGRMFSAPVLAYWIIQVIDLHPVVSSSSISV